MDSEPTIRLTCTTPIPTACASPSPTSPPTSAAASPSSSTDNMLHPPHPHPHPPPPGLPRVPSGISLVLPTHHLSSHAAAGSSYASHAAALGIHRTPSPLLQHHHHHNHHQHQHQHHHLASSPSASGHHFPSPLSASTSVNTWEGQFGGSAAAAVDSPGIDEDDDDPVEFHGRPKPALSLSGLSQQRTTPTPTPVPTSSSNANHARYASVPSLPISTAEATTTTSSHGHSPSSSLSHLVTGFAPTISASPTTANPAPTSSAHLIIFMVGLPARGKSYISQKLVRYLTWLGYHTKVFNVGNRRRTVATASSTLANDAAKAPDTPQVAGQGATSTFFDPTNTSAATLRDQLALDTLDELIDWLQAAPGNGNQGGTDVPTTSSVSGNGSPRIAIHDATNTTRARRHLLMSRLKSRLAASACAAADHAASPQQPRIKFLFLESVCTDPLVIAANVRMKLQSPDYRTTPAHVALADFTQRMRNYERAYQPLGEYEDGHKWPYVKLVDVGRKVEVSGLRGYLVSQVVFYLMNINIRHRTIWLTRHGESTSNVAGRIGGDAPLTDRGQRYANALARFFAKVYGGGAACAPRLESSQPARRQSVGAEAVGVAGKRTRFGTAVECATPVPVPAGEDEASGEASGRKMEGIAEAVERESRESDHEEEEEEDEEEYESSDGDYHLDDVTPPASPSPTASLSPLHHPTPTRAHHTGEHAGGKRRALPRIPIWTSTLRRAISTALPLTATLPHRMPLRTLRLLNEIHSGAFENLTPLEIEAGFPGEVARRQADKLAYRYPGLGGESYLDVIARLKPMIVETERITRDVCIVTHNVVARIMMAYWLGVPWDEMPRLEVPLGEVYAMQPRPYGTEVVRFRWDEETDEIVRVDEEKEVGVGEVGERESGDRVE